MADPGRADWLVAKLAAEKAAIEKKHHLTLGQALKNWRVLTLAIINFCSIIGSLGVGLWLPQIMRQLGLSAVEVGLVSAVPYVCGAIAMVVWARMSDRGTDRTFYPAVSLLVGSVGLVTSTFLTSPAATWRRCASPSPGSIPSWRRSGRCPAVS